MGKNSTEVLTCKIKLSITNVFLKKIKSSVKKANFGKIIADKTYGYAELLGQKWYDDKGIFGNIASGTGFMPADIFFSFTGIGAVANASWTDVYIEYKLKVDLYHLVRKKKGKLAAQIIKRFKKKRRKLVCKEMKKEIRKGFNDKISEKAGIFSGLSGIAVKVSNVEVY